MVVRVGTNFSENVYGTIFSDSLYGSGGNDNLYGYSGNDYLNGGSGNDWMYGGTGDDRFVVSSAFDRVIEYSGQGVDTVFSYIYSYTLPTYVEKLTLYGNAVIGRGTSFGNTITGNSKNNYLYGYGGNDSLYGVGGNDTLSGGYGNDYLNGGYGNDWMYGGFGNDRFVVNSSLDRVIEYSGQGVDTVLSYVSYTLPTYVEKLTLYGNAVTGRGTSFGNTITGNNKNNYLYGYGGNDALSGGNGNDYLSGGSGNDTLTGGYGNDTLVGGAGRDVLNDGGGRDKFKYFSTAESLTGYTRRDVIPSLDRGIDVIDLSYIDANRNIVGNQAFQFIGTAGFSGRAGQVRYYRSGSNAVVQVDVEGDGNLLAEMEIQLNGVSFLSASDFIL